MSAHKVANNYTGGSTTHNHDDHDSAYLSSSREKQREKSVGLDNSKVNRRGKIELKLFPPEPEPDPETNYEIKNC